MSDEVVFPNSFKAFMNGGVKVLADVPPPSPNPHHCSNCGGRGMMTAFIVSHGPFLHVPPLGKGEVLKSVDDAVYGWVWYTGKQRAEQCPDCLGTGRKRNNRS